ncbi:MAG: hypothetical protein QM811_27125 [Pirellulales bacterium]
MWCSRCRRDVPSSAGKCGACGSSTADGETSRGRVRSDADDAAAFAVELRRVRRMIANVDRVLGDARIPTAPLDRAASKPFAVRSARCASTRRTGTPHRRLISHRTLPATPMTNRSSIRPKH